MFILECKVKTKMDKESSKPSGARFTKKEEERKRECSPMAPNRLGPPMQPDTQFCHCAISKHQFALLLNLTLLVPLPLTHAFCFS